MSNNQDIRYVDKESMQDNIDITKQRLNTKQPSVLNTPIEVLKEERTTVEDTLQALNNKEIEMSWDEYQALSYEEQHDGRTYYVYGIMPDGSYLPVLYEMPDSTETELPDKYTILYIGESTQEYIKGGIYQYDATEDEWTLISAGGISDAIVYVDTLPVSDIKNIIYGLITENGHSGTVADGFLDSSNLFEKTTDGDNYSYTPFEGIILEGSTDDVEYKNLTSIEYNNSTSKFTINYDDGTDEVINIGDTFYYKELIRLYYAGNETEQTLNLLGSGGSGGSSNYFAGEGVDISNSFISIKSATPAEIGGIKPDNETVVTDANGTLSGNYEGGYGIKIDGNDISTRTFVGSSAEWEALSSEEQAEFDQVSLNDDYSEIIENPGHNIINESNISLPQRNNLKINGATITDDSANDTTIITPDEYTAGRGIDIDINKEISVDDNIRSTFIGTKAEWDALTATEKAKYELVDLTDDITGGDTAVADIVEDGNLNPVTSNAVYDAINDLPQFKFVSYTVPRNTVAASSNGIIAIPTDFDNTQYNICSITFGLGANNADCLLYYEGQTTNAINVGYITGSSWNTGWIWNINILLMKK